MASRGSGSFSFDPGGVDRIVGKIKQERQKAHRLTVVKMNKAVDIMYRVARQKRPYISKAQMKSEGRRTKVSDPSAEAGVPVAAINGGALQASIKKKVSDKGYSVVGIIEAGGASAPYAKYLEFGTSKMAARPFMRPAIDLTRQAIKNMFAKKET